MRVTLIALALALSTSAAVGGPHLWRLLDGEHERWSDASSVAVERAPAEALSYPPEAFEFFAARVGFGDRYYVHTPDGPPDLGRGERGTILLLAQYLLLPAVIAPHPGDATVVLAYLADPSTLRLDYSRIERFPGPVEASVAWVSR